MKMYKITKGQRNLLTLNPKFNGMNFHPIQDINGDWFISQVEMDFCQERFGFQPEETEFIPPAQESLFSGL